MSTNIPFSGPKDRHGKSQRDPVPPLPLTFDRVMENRLPMSDSALFKLPVEVLGLILGFVEPSSLATLALVNRECRQLARSRQFAGVHLDYSHSSEALVLLLVSEAVERTVNNGSTSLPSLGVCIRRMTVATSTDILRRRFDIPVVEFGSDEGLYRSLLEAQQPKWQVANKSVEGFYLPLVQIILCYGKTLPHLEFLDWEDNTNLSPFFYNALACSSIQHLKLYRPIVNEEFEIMLPQTLVSRGWLLRTLHLELNLDMQMKVTTARLCASILRLCASTLETLVWSGTGYKDYQTFGDGLLPNFLCLRNLHLGVSLALADTSVMDAFLKSKLVNLSIEIGIHLINKALDSCGRIPSLETLSMSNPPLSFLQANTQLSKIDFSYEGFSAESLEIEVLPLLSNFSNLTSLRVVWPPSCLLLPETGLRLISNLHTLNQLGIWCGYVRGWKRNWKVDHEAIRQHLSPLKYLKKLALLGDTYDSGIHFSTFERYYVDTYATQDDLGYDGVALHEVPDEERRPMLDVELGKPYWEEKHKRKMVVEAKKYIDVLPKLEWIYLGERAMCIEEDDSGIGLRRVVSTIKLEETWSYFEKMFGILVW